MPIQMDTPISTGTESDWGLYPAGVPDKMTAVRTNNGDASIIYASSGGRNVIETMVFPALAGIADPVAAASVTGVTRVYLRGAGGQSYYAMWNGVRVGTNRWTALGPTTYQYHAITYNAAGAELALAAVNGQHGFFFSAAGGPSNKAEVWMTQLYRTVNFSYAGGNAGEFTYMIGSLAGAFIGSGLLFREMPALARFLWRRAGYLIKPSEYAEAYRAWKEAPCH